MQTATKIKGERRLRPAPYFFGSKSGSFDDVARDTSRFVVGQRVHYLPIVRVALWTVGW
jgi:hypothetical protein